MPVQKQVVSENPRVRVVVLNIPQPEPKPRSNPNLPAITINPERLGGTPTIAGTRMPVSALLDHLSGGHTIKDFLEAFSGDLTEGDCEAVLDQIKEALEDGLIGTHIDE